jgi:hypothetical protein
MKINYGEGRFRHVLRDRGSTTMPLKSSWFIQAWTETALALSLILLHLAPVVRIAGAIRSSMVKPKSSKKHGASVGGCFPPAPTNQNRFRSCVYQIMCSEAGHDRSSLSNQLACAQSNQFPVVNWFSCGNDSDFVLIRLNCLHTSSKCTIGPLNNRGLYSDLN